uniref:Ovule protein n=1 Tax=Brugia pahangi TaxID=6280 RepID=A0A0N4TZP7_BRUPA
MTSCSYLLAPITQLHFHKLDTAVGAELCRWSKCDISQSYTTQSNKRDREAIITKHGKLHPPKINKLKLEEWKTSITNVMNSSGTKQLLVMQ